MPGVALAGHLAGHVALHGGLVLRAESLAEQRGQDAWDPAAVLQAQFAWEAAFLSGQPTAWDVAQLDTMYADWVRGAVTPQAQIFHGSAPLLYGGALAALWSVLRHPQRGPVTQARHDQARDLALPFQRPPANGFDFTPSLEEQATLSLRMARSQMHPVTFRATDAWGVQNLPVINWARTRGLALVTDLTEQQLATTQGIILSALGGNLARETVAPLIELTIDLHPTQAKWVQDRLARDLASGMSRQEAYVQSRAFSEQLLRQRALTIARTEIMAAENEGQLEAWRQAVRDGLIPPQARKVWVMGPGACPTCAQVNGKAVKLEDPFPLVDVLVPPAHPNCRCTVGLAADRGRVADLAGINLRTHQPLAKHQAGGHDQATHGRRAGGGLPTVSGDWWTASEETARSYAMPRNNPQATVLETTRLDTAKAEVNYGQNKRPAWSQGGDVFRVPGSQVQVDAYSTYRDGQWHRVELGPAGPGPRLYRGIKNRQGVSLVVKHQMGGHDQKTHGHRGNAGGEQERIAAATARIQAALPNADLTGLHSQATPMLKETLEQCMEGGSPSYNAMKEAGFPDLTWDKGYHAVMLKPTASELEAIADAAEHLAKVSPNAAGDCKRLEFQSLMDSSGLSSNLAQANWTSGTRGEPGWRVTFDLERTRMAMGESFGGGRPVSPSSSLFRQASSPTEAQRVIALHEFAHGVAMSGEMSHQVMGRPGYGLTQKLLFDPSPAGLHSTWTTSELRATRTVSDYARSNPGEFFAENVASLWSGIGTPHGDTRHWLAEYLAYRESQVAKAQLTEADVAEDGAIEDDFGEEPWLGWASEIVKHQLGTHDQKTHGHRGNAQGGSHGPKDIGPDGRDMNHLREMGARIQKVIDPDGMVDLTGLDADAADQITWAVEEFAQKYPDAARKVASVMTTEAGDRVAAQEEAVAATYVQNGMRLSVDAQKLRYAEELTRMGVKAADPEIRQLQLHPPELGEPTPMIRVSLHAPSINDTGSLGFQQLVGDTVRGSPYAVAVHEMGHVLNHARALAYDPNIREADYDRYDYAGDHVPDDPWRGVTVSRYARESIAEAVAEVFTADWFRNREVPRLENWRGLGDETSQPAWLRRILANLKMDMS